MTTPIKKEEQKNYTSGTCCMDTNQELTFFSKKPEVKPEVKQEEEQQVKVQPSTCAI